LVFGENAILALKDAFQLSLNPMPGMENWENQWKVIKKKS